jgi:hypothetical protein
MMMMMTTTTKRHNNKAVPLYFVHCLNYKIAELRRFGSCTLLPSSGKKEASDMV